MNLPTKLTVGRIALAILLLIVLFVCDILCDAKVLTVPMIGPINLVYLIAFVIFVVASFTDLLDGYLARKNNQVTDLGKFLDPVADKILVNSVLIYLALPHFSSGQATIPLFCVILMIARDLVIDAFRLSAATKGAVLAANVFGKLKTIFQMVAIPLVLLNGWPFSYFDADWGYFRICNIAIYLATAMSLLSLAIYLIQNRHILKEGKKE